MTDADSRIVQETLDAFPFDRPARTLSRREDLLLQRAVPLPGPAGALWEDVESIEVVRAGAIYQPSDFRPPRWIYQGALGRIEWQTMDNRQPIYHRNLDVDEMSFQVVGDRTLMTELGTVELRPGDFVRIPVGVCHDNWGREDIHILWYLPEPLTEQLDPVRISEAKIPPFEGWEPYIANELITDCLGSTHQDADLAAHRSDERLILEQVHRERERLAVVRPPELEPGHPSRAVTSIWRGAQVAIDVVDLDRDPGLVYTRHRNVDEIQFQIAGTRTLVTQHGCVELNPGDFTRIPIGVAATSITEGASRHIATMSFHRLPRVYPEFETGEWWDAEQVERYREKVLA